MKCRLSLDGERWFDVDAEHTEGKDLGDAWKWASIEGLVNVVAEEYELQDGDLITVYLDAGHLSGNQVEKCQVQVRNCWNVQPI